MADDPRPSDEVQPPCESQSAAATAESNIAAVFGRGAATYERVRPQYPEAAVDWLLPAGCRRVLDLGAGTGKLTRSLVARGLDVIAVEPSAGMRQQFAAALPDVPLLAGTAERIPLMDAQVDAVLVAQAWHWVDPSRAVPEVARVLRPGGGFGVVWNVRDTSVDWVDRLGQILHTNEDTQMPTDDPPVGPPFGPLEHREFSWEQPMTPDELIELVASRSYCIAMRPAEREQVFAAVRRLLVTNPDVAGRHRFALPYVTRCTRTRLPE